MSSNTGPSVRLTLPPNVLYQFPPSPLPETLPPAPLAEWSWTQPVPISPTLYHKLLQVDVPITIAVTYATAVVFLNRVNKSRGYKPWGFSKSQVFKALVILHNVFLAVYSAWTFAAMLQAFRQSWPVRDENYSAASVVDALCKINGPRGYGEAAVYNSQNNSWVLNSPQFHLAEGNIPDPTDVGRLWNSGLAYIGWIFYLSKFYEVLDTVIILAKGKKSSTLQTYHHAGAMMCMWAGIRYMAPPIWIFTLVNSGIHALMYTYYAITALSIKVPTVVKRTLTTLQITQFVIGTNMAGIHLFLKYTVPTTVSHAVSIDNLKSAVPAAAEAASAGLIPLAKKLFFRAAGAEGVAENVVDAHGNPFGVDAANAAAAAKARQQTQFSTEYRTVDCVDTSGQAFAIWLNVMYLLPLTYLFARFFVRSYLKREAKAPTHLQAAEKAGMDALKGVSREIRHAAIEMNGETTEEEIPTSGTVTPIPNNLKPLAPQITSGEGPSYAKVASTSPSETTNGNGKKGKKNAS